VKYSLFISKNIISDEILSAWEEYFAMIIRNSWFEIQKWSKCVIWDLINFGVDIFVWWEPQLMEIRKTKPPTFSHVQTRHLVTLSAIVIIAYFYQDIIGQTGQNILRTL